MFKPAFPADLLEAVKMAKVMTVKEVVVVNEDKTIKIRQEIERAQRIIVILYIIAAKKRGILPIFIQNRHKY